MKRPRLLLFLAATTLAVACFRMSHAATEQLLRYTVSHEAFVDHYRDSFAAAKELAKVDEAERQRIGVDLGEKEWSRRRVDLPLGLVNLVLSLLLFAGALDALRRGEWGRSAWEWAARLSIVYTVVATPLRWMAAADLRAPLEAGAKSLGAGGDAVAAAGVAFYQAATVVLTVVLVGFYAASALYLRRPAVKDLFSRRAERGA